MKTKSSMIYNNLQIIAFVKKCTAWITKKIKLLQLVKVNEDIDKRWNNSKKVIQKATEEINR